MQCFLLPTNAAFRASQRWCAVCSYESFAVYIGTDRRKIMSQNVPKNVHLLQFRTFFRTVEVMETQNSLFYSTGEAAQLLQTSQDTIRRLCESGPLCQHD